MDKRTRKNDRLSYERLEIRQMMARTSVEVINGVETLLIDGTGHDDYVEVSLESNNMLTVTFDDFPGSQTTSTASMPRGEIERIRFQGKDGNNTFINHTSIVSTAFGNKGNDVLHGGGGFNRIRGGAGNDEVVGGDKKVVLRGDDGNDRIEAGEDQRRSQPPSTLFTPAQTSPTNDDSARVTKSESCILNAPTGREILQHGLVGGTDRD